MKFGIVIGSVREGRRGEEVAQWVYSIASQREGVEYSVIDLAAFDLPLLTDATIPAAANRHYATAQVQAWSEAIDECDGFVFITPEYNHGIPGAFKNAFDSIYPEWNHKGLLLVSYGADSGVRAVEHWRTVAANALLYVTRGQVSLSNFAEFDDDGRFTPDERRVDELAGCLDQLESLTRAVAVLR